MDSKRYASLDVNRVAGHHRESGDGNKVEKKATRWGTFSGSAADRALVPRSSLTTANGLLLDRTKSLTGATNYRYSPVGLLGRGTIYSDPTTNYGHSSVGRFDRGTTYSDSTTYRNSQVSDLETDNDHFGRSSSSTARDTSLRQHGESLAGVGGYSRLPASPLNKETTKDSLVNEFSSLGITDSLYCWSKIEDANLLFYQGKLPCKPYNVTIDEIHQDWYHDMDKLEFTHGYIQWLFPVSESGGLNLYSQALQPHEAEGICNDEQAMTRFRKSYEMMLNFYGMRIVDNNTGELERTDNWKERFHNLSTFSHNYMRITRILMSLGELGLEIYKINLVRFLLKEAIETEELSRTLPSCQNYWIATVQDESDRILLMQYAVDLAGDARKRRQGELESAGAEVKDAEQRSPSVKGTEQELFSCKDTEHRSTLVKDTERMSASVKDMENRTKDREHPTTSSDQSGEEDDHSKAEARTDRQALISPKPYQTHADRTESQYTSTQLERLSTKLASIALNLRQLIGERSNLTTVKPKQTRALHYLTEEVSFVWAELSQISIAEDQKLHDQERMLSGHSKELFLSQTRRSPEPERSGLTRAQNGGTKPERSRPTTTEEESFSEDEPIIPTSNGRSGLTAPTNQTDVLVDRDRFATVKQSSVLAAKEKNLPKDWFGHTTTEMPFTTELNSATESYDDSNLRDTERERHQRPTNKRPGDSSTVQHRRSSETDQTRPAVKPSRTEDQHRLQQQTKRSLASPTQEAAERAHIRERTKEMHEEDDTSETDPMDTPNSATRTERTTSEKFARSTSDQNKQSGTATLVHKSRTITPGSSRANSVDQPRETLGQRRDRPHTVTGLPGRPQPQPQPRTTKTPSLNHYSSLR